MPFYIFQGKVLPERALVHLNTPKLPIHFDNGTECTLTLSIALNQITAFIETENVEVRYLRNFLFDFVHSQLSILAFTHGHAYDLEITRVITPDREVDWVFGIDTPCVRPDNLPRESDTDHHLLAMLTLQEHGHFLRRFFTDLSFAMKHAYDTGFYCFRALEALRQHCSALCSDGAEAKKSVQWEFFRARTNVLEPELQRINIASQSARHGGTEGVTDESRVELLTSTWRIAQIYFDTLFCTFKPINSAREN